MRLPGLLVVCLTVAAAQPAGTGVIAGAVVDASTDATLPQPVRKAVVTVTWHGTPRSWATIQTDSAGRFRFDGLPAGVYDLRATKAGSGVAIYGANSSRETGENITLADGEKREGLKLRFIRSASISGTVLGPDGDPVINAQVMLMRPTRNNGKLALAQAGNAQTDDRGQYHTANVQPGRYYAFVNATGPQFPESDRIVSGEFYGGAHDLKDATAITIRDGDHLRGIDFTLTPEMPVRIRVQVTGMPAEPAPPASADAGERFWRRSQVQIGLTRISSFPGGFGNQGSDVQPPDYHAEFGPLSPGEYRVVARTTIENTRYSASQLVDVRAGVADVTLTLAAPVEVKGQLKIEGPTSGAPARPSVTLSPVGPNGINYGVFGNENMGTQIGPDGKFSIPQVGPGAYDVNITGFGRGGFIKSVRFGDDEVSFKPIEIKPGSEAPLNIVISMRGAKVEGEVDAAGGDPARAGILLVPVGEFHEFTRFYYSVSADDHGKFRLLGLAPGKYKIFALEKLAPTPLRSPEFADQLIALDGDYAQEIELKEDGATEAHPKLIPLERGRAILP